MEKMFLTPETLLLTPNRRLAASLLKEYQHKQQQEKKISWPTPNILPFTLWLQKEWEHHVAQQIKNPFTLLTSNEENIVWEKILRESDNTPALLQLTETAKLSQSAFHLLQQWQIPLSDSALTLTEDSRLFIAWAKQFDDFCQKKKIISPSCLPTFIKEKIQSHEILPPKKMILQGFIEISPQYQSLLDACKEQQTEIIHHKTTPKKNNVMQRIALTDQENEIQTMARWAKKLFDSTSETISIACIIPNLEKRRDTVTRIFSYVFSEKNTYTLDPIHLPFNISAGKSLLDYPVIHTALQLLQLHKKNHSTDKIINIVQSPFIGDAENECIARAHFANTLQSQSSIALNDLLKENTEKNIPLFFKRMEKFFSHLTFLETYPEKKGSLREWATFFSEQLRHLGWPGERRLNSVEYQAVQRFSELFSEFEQCDRLFEKKSYADALHYFSLLCATTVFQPQTPDAPIQILGILEAAGLSFDYAWIMELDDTHWPSPPNPNPFIPIALQKIWKMPHATAERELTYCHHIMEQIIHHTEHVIFSHAEKNHDLELNPSPLIMHAAPLFLDTLPQSEFVSPLDFLYQTRSIDYFQDDSAPAIQENTVRGGATIFKQQAACPFRAFAEYRLHARKPDEKSLGLNHQDRGSIVHKVMELIWKEIIDSEKLHHYSEEALKRLLQQSIADGIFWVTHKKITDSYYLSLESQRLFHLISRWMEVEKNRPFFKVIAIEEEKIFSLKNMTIHLRIDRIDELQDGKKMIIDYKTGKNNTIQDWFEERLTEPQLPLYCTLESNVSGIAFAEINSTKMQLKGVSEKESAISSMKMLHEIKNKETISWENQITSWRTQLEKSATDFSEGHAAVDPKEKKATCRHCHLHSFCRITEER